MKKYFSEIKKPKWYMAIIAVVIFAIQCTAIINLGFGMGTDYFVIIPLQVIAGYLDVMIYLMVQKDAKSKRFWAYAAISLVAGALVGIVAIEELYTSVAGYKGVVYGAFAQLSIACAVYAIIGVIRSFKAPKEVDYVEY